MAKRSAVSQGASYRDIGEFWDTHDATEHGSDDAVEVDVQLASQRHYFAVDRDLCSRIRALATARGVSEETLLNLFLQERLEQCDKEQGRQSSS
jgi:hypothetical protein